VLGKADVQIAGYVGERIGDAASPVLGALSQPIQATRRALDRVGEMLAVYEENARLREENRRLLAWQAEAARLSVQNRALREMLKVPATEQAPAWTTARVVGDAGGPFVHSLLIDAGAERGVRKGMAALTPEGLAGRVVSVGRRRAPGPLITDFDSKIPRRRRALARPRDPGGDNGAEPPPLPADDPELRVGDLVLTSGDGGLCRRARSAGERRRRSAGRVRPFVDWSGSTPLCSSTRCRRPRRTGGPPPCRPVPAAPAGPRGRGARRCPRVDHSCAACCRRDALLAVLVDLLPLPDSAPQSLAPSLTVCVFAFWTLVRPS
jgi:rod shape-determining protein MreC